MKSVISIQLHSLINLFMYCKIKQFIFLCRQIIRLDFDFYRDNFLILDYLQSEGCYGFTIIFILFHLYKLVKKYPPKNR